MNIIVLQHIKIEDPGYIKDLMLADGLELTTIELDEGEKIPKDLSKFDGMFCMGGMVIACAVFSLCLKTSTINETTKSIGV